MESTWVTGKTHSIKIALLAKAVSKPALILPVLILPGSPGTCTVLPLAARQDLPGTSLLHQQWWQLEEMCPDTCKMVIWRAEWDHPHSHVHKFGSAARPRPSSSDLFSLQHLYPLPVLKLNFRPIPRVPNGVIYSGCRLLPTGPHEIEKKNHWDLTFIFISILFSLLFSN